MGNEGSSQPGDYKEPQLPEGVLEVRVSVYKLKLTGSGLLDGVGASMLGAYHSGLVICGQEWAFGGHDEEGISGVFACDPEMNTDYSFYQRVIMGRISATKEQVEAQINELAETPDWAGTQYDLTERNCNHFTSALCWLLMKKRPPEWINQTCENIQRSRTKMRAEQASKQETLKLWEEEQAVPATINPETGERNELPGEQALSDTHAKTFEAAWVVHWEEAKQRIQSRAEDADPDQVKADALDDALAKGAEAAKAAALQVATASVMAKAARAQQPTDGLAAWEQVWKKESAVLVKMWREAAIKQNLKAEDAPTRKKQLDLVLAKAAKAANVAAAEAAAASPGSPAAAAVVPLAAPPAAAAPNPFEPAAAPPAAAAPNPFESTTTQPAAAAPNPFESAAIQPAAAAPNPFESAASQPAAADPNPFEPAIATPAAAAPNPFEPAIMTPDQS